MIPTDEKSDDEGQIISDDIIKTMNENTKDNDVQIKTIEAELKQNKRRTKQRNPIVQNLKDVIYYFLLFLRSL